MSKDRLDVSDNTSISMPVRNMLAIIAAVATGAWAYFGELERITMLETKSVLTEKDISQHVERLEADLTKNTEFRIKWPRGEMGSLPADSEQFMLIEHLAQQLDELSAQADEGRLPHDQQQKLTLEFYEKRISAIEARLEKMRNGNNGH